MTSPLKAKQCHSHAMNAMLAHMLTILNAQYFTYKGIVTTHWSGKCK